MTGITISIPANLAGDVSDLPLLVDDIPGAPTWRAVPAAANLADNTAVASLTPVVGTTPVSQATVSAQPVVVSGGSVWPRQVLRCVAASIGGNVLPPASQSHTIAVVFRVVDAAATGRYVVNEAGALLSQGTGSKVAQAYTGGGALSHSPLTIGATPQVWLVTRNVAGDDVSWLGPNSRKSGTLSNPANTSLFLGGDNTSSGVEIADVVVWDRALSDTEALAAMAALRTYWGF